MPGLRRSRRQAEERTVRHQSRWAKAAHRRPAIPRHRRARNQGQFLGIDLDDTAYIPAARALELYNRDGLMEIDVSYQEGVPATQVSAAIKSHPDRPPRPRGLHDHDAGGTCCVRYRRFSTS